MTDWINAGLPTNPIATLVPSMINRQALWYPSLPELHRGPCQRL